MNHESSGFDLHDVLAASHTQWVDGAQQLLDAICGHLSLSAWIIGSVWIGVRGGDRPFATQSLLESQSNWPSAEVLVGVSLRSTS